MRKTRRQKRRLFLAKGAVHPSVNYFIFMHPRSNVRFSAVFLDKEEKSSFYHQLLSLLWFFRKVFVQNLVVPWDFDWKSNWTQKFDKIFTQSMTLIVYENIYALTSVIDWGGEWFLKILCIIKTPHTSYIKPCNKKICDGYVSEWVNFQRVFVKTSNILITLQVWHITTSLTVWGGARKSSFFQKILKLTAFLSQKRFLIYLNQLRSKISKDLKFLIRGENVI